jgi:hypothetical protein
LLHWDNSDGHVQLNWARDFYRNDAKRKGDVPEAESTTQQNEDEDHE